MTIIMEDVKINNTNNLIDTLSSQTRDNSKQSSPDYLTANNMNSSSSNLSLNQHEEQQQQQNTRTNVSLSSTRLSASSESLSNRSLKINYDVNPKEISQPIQHQSPVIIRKTSRKVLERKKRIEIDDNEFDRLIVESSFIEEAPKTNIPELVEPCVDHEDELNLNSNSAFDQLFEAGNKSISVQVKMAEAALATKQQSDLIESHLGTPQTLTRSCSCKRPGSFKKLKNSKQSSNRLTVHRKSIQQQQKQQQKKSSSPASSDDLELNKSQGRAGSLPFENLDEAIDQEIYRLRCFNITSKGSVINRGDSFKRSLKKSSQSVNKQTTPDDLACSNSINYESTLTNFRPKSNSIAMKRIQMNEEHVESFSILILGATNVGKHALIKQFKTSEYSGTYDINGLDELNSSEDDQCVSVMLDNVESTLCFTAKDINSVNYMNYNNDNISTGYDAYIVVYSITDKNSFDIAIDILKSIRISEVKNHPVILVGNKSDLVRKRSLSREDGRTLALRYTCKFVETSVAINDKVDDLLAGILKQIRLSEGIDNDHSYNEDNTSSILVIDTTMQQRKTDVKNNLKKRYSSKQQQQNFNVRMKEKQSKSFFQLVFRNIFKKKSSKLSILSSVENLFTAPVKISKYKS